MEKNINHIKDDKRKVSQVGFGLFAPLVGSLKMVMLEKNGVMIQHLLDMGKEMLLNNKKDLEITAKSQVVTP